MIASQLANTPLMRGVSWVRLGVYGCVSQYDCGHNFAFLSFQTILYSEERRDSQLSGGYTKLITVSDQLSVASTEKICGKEISLWQRKSLWGN